MPFLFISLNKNDSFIKALSFFYVFYYVFIFFEVMRQITKHKEVRLNVLFGALCGYLLLVLISNFTFILIEIFRPHSFNGISVGQPAQVYNELSYFSLITLTSIGFGDIVPLTDSARLATAFFGMMGQFYLAAVVGIVISRFTSSSN